MESQDLSFWQRSESKLRVYSFMRPRKVLFVKTPKNCVRILALRQIFPEAKILFLYRDPRAILRSWWQAKGYHHLTSGYHRHPYYAKQSDGKFYWQPPPLEGEDLAGYSYDEIVARADAATEGPRWNTYESFCHRVLQFKGALEYHLDNSVLLRGDHYIRIAYEDLCENPVSVLTRMFEFMGVSWTGDDTRAKEFFSSRNYKYRALPEQMREFAEQELREVGLRLGYEW